jgi:aspartate/tyrosine/aromatic aminotransferase
MMIKKLNFYLLIIIILLIKMSISRVTKCLSTYAKYAKYTKHLTLVQQPVDKILGLNQVFKADPAYNKINLIVGAYRDRTGQPYIFESVKKAKQQLDKKSVNFEYLPMEGDTEFLKLSKELYFGQSTHYDNVQTLSGTGSLKLAADFLAETFDRDNQVIHLPNPTWGNHSKIFSSAGLAISTYQYLNSDRKFYISNLLESINKIPNNQIILLHACAHNPSGYDPTPKQWEQIIRLCKSKNLYILIDFAYLGFASGNLKLDSCSLEIMNREKYPSLVCTSYAKNFGLYSERVGNLFFTGTDDTETQLMKDTMKTIIRRSYSNPPANGSNIIKTILSDGILKDIWRQELHTITDHYIDIRNLLKTNLENKINKDFSDITNQCGMFYYSTLTPQQVLYMRSKGIYFPDDGRISLAAINKENIDYITDIWSSLSVKN